MHTGVSTACTSTVQYFAGGAATRRICATNPVASRCSMQSSTATCSSLADTQLGRRQVLRSGLIVVAVDFWAVAARASILAVDNKQNNSNSVEQVKQRVAEDFQEGQYFITGRLSPDLFTPDCEFRDPVSTVYGPKAYMQGVSLIFDPERSRADLISSEVLNDHQFSFRFRFAGTFKTPFHPTVKPYLGTVVYDLNDQGLISKSQEFWDIPPREAVLSIFFPNIGTPPAAPVR